MSTNATCFPPRAPQEGPPLFQHGNIVFQAHDVGWIVSGFFTIVACVASFWLINKHLQWYTNKLEQRYIVRLLLMVPIYATISLASYLFWNHSTPLLLVRDAYEAILLTAFFYLLLTYLSPDLEEQKAVFRRRGLSGELDAELRRRGQPPKKWVLPLSFVRWKPQDGLFFLQLMKWGVLQYCVVRPTTTLAAVVLNYIGWYCEQSWSPAWGHIYITLIISLSVTIAMYCLLQLYLCVAEELAPRRPVLKLFSVKAVVFLTFWQATFLSMLSMFGVVKDTPYMTAEDINIGWGAILETFEMSLFAFIHIKAFSYKPYRPLTPDAKRTPRLRSFVHAMDFRETFRELRSGWVHMWHRMRGRETDPLARRAAVLEGAFDKSRMQVWRECHAEEKEPAVVVDRVVEVEVDGERQWLGVGDDYAYGLSRRERSEGLGVQFERELDRRGYGRSGDADQSGEGFVHERRQRSWWRSAYDRVSQGHPDRDDSSRVPSPPKRQSRSRRTSRDVEQHVRVYDDQPPSSILQTYRDKRRASQLLPPGAQVFQLPVHWETRDERGAPQDAVPAPTSGLPTADRRPPIVRVDTVLDRLFQSSPPRSSGGHTSRSGGTSAVPPSSLSHRTQVLLTAPPAVLTQQMDVARPVELTAWHLPSSPVASSSPLQQPRSPAPRNSRRSSHRRESAHHQDNLVPEDSLAIPTFPSTPPSAPGPPPASPRSDGPSWPAGPQQCYELHTPLSPPPASHRSRRSRTHERTSPAGPASSLRRGSTAEAGPQQPERRSRSRSRGAPRRTSAPVLPPPLPPNRLVHPDARSPPSAPRADPTLSRYQQL